MKQIREYRSSGWQRLREKIFNRDSYRCVRCGRTIDEVELHLHHISYLPNRAPWDYPHEMLITLCKGCHAEEHGVIMPQSGWNYIAYNDLGDLCGQCEVCGNQLRYEHIIYHPLWGYLSVGEYCANKLTCSDEASDYEKYRRQESQKLVTFVKSSRWKHVKNGYFIDQKGYKVKIWDNGNSFRLVISFWDKRKGEWTDLSSNKKYSSLDNAKISAYKTIATGSLEEYIKKKYPYVLL